MEKKSQLDETIADSISLETLNSGFKFPPMPANGLKLMRLIRQPVEKIDVDELVKLVETDPGLYSMVLQMANSAYFKGVERVISLRSAISRVGLDEVIDAVNFYFFQGAFPKLPEIKNFSPKEYWAFSWACATSARRLGHPNLGFDTLPGELYIAGLLHGIGKLIFAVNKPGPFSDCIQLAQETQQPLHVVERLELGTTDTLVAAKLMEIWHLPETVIAGVQYFQEPEASPEKYRGVAGIIQYAYSLASRSGIGINGDGGALDPETTWVVTSSRTPLKNPKVRESLEREIFSMLEAKSESITGVSAKGLQKEKGHAGRSNQKKAANGKGLFSWIKSVFQ